MKSFKLVLLLIGVMFISCEEQEKLGILYLLNTSSAQQIELVSKSGKSMTVEKGILDIGLVYFANIYGTWSEKGHYYGTSNCAVGSPIIKSIVIDDTEYILNDSISQSFFQISSYKKMVDEREEYYYEMDDHFVEQVTGNH